MSTRRITAAMVAAAAAALALSACAGGAGEASGNGASSPASDCTPAHEKLPTITAGTLTVAAYVSPPYTVDEGGKITGIDGEIITAIAGLECLQLDFQAVQGAALPSTVSSGRADVAIGGIYRNPEREEQFSLTDAMYLDQAALLSRDGIATVDGLKGKKLGVIQGYLWNEEFQATLGTDNVVIYQDSASLVGDIKNGRVDAGAFTSAEASLRAQEDGALKAAVLKPSPDVPSTQQPNDVVLFLAKGSTELTEAFNADIATLIADGSIADVLKKYNVDPSLVAGG